MLETPKSAKTPSTARIPDSCATSAILENGACTSVTFAPKILSRSRASSSACASRSRLINRPEINLSAIAFECPPAPSVASMYVPSGLTRNHSSTSPSITGVCAAANLFGPSQRRLYAATPSKLLNPKVTQSLVVLVRVRIVFQLIQGTRMVHHIEIIEGAKYIHFACRAGDVKLVPILLQGLQKHGRYLQPALLVHLRRTIPPQLHAPRLTRPRFDRDQAQKKCGLVRPKCPLSPQSLLLVLSVLPCYAPTARRLFLLSPTSYHFYPHNRPCLALVKRKHAFFQDFSKKVVRNLLQVSGDFCRDCLWFWIQTPSTVGGWVLPFVLPGC